MLHESRIATSKQIAIKLLGEQNKNLLYVGAHGSILDGSDRKNSDIDLISVFRDNVVSPQSNLPWVCFNFKGIVLSLGFHTLEELDGIVSRPNYKWPHVAGKFIHNHTIYCDLDIKKRYRKMIERMDQTPFIEAAKIEYMEALSGFGGMEDLTSKKPDIGTVKSQSLKFLRRVEVCIALVNRGFLHGETSFKNIQIIGDFNTIPDKYAELAKIIWENNKEARIYSAVEKLWGNFTVFAHANGIENQNHSSIAEFGVLTKLKRG